MNSEGPALTCQVSFKRSQQGRKRLAVRRTSSIAVASARTPRVSKLTALSIRLGGLIKSGEVQDWADAARLAHITRARASQIAALTLVAPDIIEALLFLPTVERGRDPITERDLRPIAAELNWDKQRKQWGLLCRERGVSVIS